MDEKRFNYQSACGEDLSSQARIKCSIISDLQPRFVKFENSDPRTPRNLSITKFPMKIFLAQQQVNILLDIITA